MVRLGDDGAWQVERVKLEGHTVVHDVVTNRAFMTIDGIVVLPVGAEIQLASPNANARIIGLRLLPGLDHNPVTVCLDVTVPDEWWSDARPASDGIWP
jgi:hypothetical protein